MFTAAYSFVFLDGWRRFTSDTRRASDDILVVETSFGDQLCDGGLSTFEAGLWTRSGSGLLPIVPTTGGAPVAGSLAPSDSFLLWTC
jgi:hypothetical protein